MPAPVDWRQARLQATRDLTADIRLFEIATEGDFVPPTPGCHLNVTVHVDGRADTRSYSVVDAGRDGLYRIAVKLLPHSRGGSRYMWSLRPGARLVVSTPGNHFELRRGRPQYLLVAGGIGITPIHAMATALVEAGASPRLLYGARSHRDLAFADELSSLLGDRLRLALDDEGQRIDFAGEISSLHPDGEVYMCGPIGMMEAVKRTWAASGRPLDHLRFETFGNSGRHATLPFTVKIPRLGLEIEVPQNRTMLEAIEAAGVAMIHDCRRGECGLCALPILEAGGVIDHRDVFFSEEEKSSNARLCTCVSRVAGGSISVDTADRAA
jgi:ferredoxin-NADP reductase